MSLLLPFSISIGDEWRLIPDIMHVSTSQKQVKHPLFELALKHDPARMIIRGSCAIKVPRRLAFDLGEMCRVDRLDCGATNVLWLICSISIT